MNLKEWTYKPIEIHGGHVLFQIFKGSVLVANCLDEEIAKEICNKINHFDSVKN